MSYALFLECMTGNNLHNYW